MALMASSPRCGVAEVRRPGITSEPGGGPAVGWHRGALARRVRAPHTPCTPCLWAPSGRYGGQPVQPKGGTVHQRQLGTVIRAARCAQRMTQAQLGLACGYSASAISRVEAGLLRPAEHSLRLQLGVLRPGPHDGRGAGRDARCGTRRAWGWHRASASTTATDGLVAIA
ncbi:helix-turn-helix domain-containing protein [Kitasatospora sp. NPDC003701]